MTVITLNIDKVPIDNKTNLTKETILNNEPLDTILHVIAVISNPCLFKRRYELAKQFTRRMNKTPNVQIYIVELAYNHEDFYVTDAANPHHLQLRTRSAPIWTKENLINIGIKKLLPTNWKAVAWIDADIEFDNIHWPLDTLKILNGYKDIVQLFTLAMDMNKDEATMHTFTGFGYNYEIGKKYVLGGPDYWHPGFAWAVTRRAYVQMGGLYEDSILGSGDHNMALGIVGNAAISVNTKVHPDYLASIAKMERKLLNLRLGYVPGVIRHYYHGDKKNRKYKERWQILVNHQYSPTKHMTRNSDNLLIPTKECPPELLTDILQYFKERNEDQL